MKHYLIYGSMGALMGYILANIGYANYDEIHRMFVFDDLRMLYTFAGAVAVVAVFSLILSGRFPKQHKIIQPGILPGNMLFGFGWAITGACPSLVFVQLGQGHMPALMTMLGILAGVLLYKKVHARYFMWDVGACSSA